MRSNAWRDFDRPETHSTTPSRCCDYVCKELADLYVDVSIGTQSLARMRAEPDALASKLVDLAAAVCRAEEERDFKH